MATATVGQKPVGQPNVYGGFAPIQQNPNQNNFVNIPVQGGNTSSIQYTPPSYLPPPDVPSLMSSFADSLQYGIGQGTRNVQNVYAGRGITGSGEEQQAFGDVSKWAGSQMAGEQNTLQQQMNQYQQNAFQFQQSTYQNALAQLPPAGTPNDTPENQALRAYLQQKLLGISLPSQSPSGTAGPIMGPNAPIQGPTGQPSVGQPPVPQPLTPTAGQTPVSGQQPTGQTQFPTNWNNVPVGGYFQDSSGRIWQKNGPNINTDASAPTDQNTAYAWAEGQKHTINEPFQYNGVDYVKDAQGNVTAISGTQSHDLTITNNKDFKNLAQGDAVKIGNEYIQKTGTDTYKTLNESDYNLSQLQNMGKGKSPGAALMYKNPDSGSTLYAVVGEDGKVKSVNQDQYTEEISTQFKNAGINQRFQYIGKWYKKINDSDFELIKIDPPSAASFTSINQGFQKDGFGDIYNNDQNKNIMIQNIKNWRDNHLAENYDLLLSDQNIQDAIQKTWAPAGNPYGQNGNDASQRVLDELQNIMNKNWNDTYGSGQTAPQPQSNIAKSGMLGFM